MASKKEQFYDKHIAPELARLGKLCQEKGLSFVCEVEWEPGESGMTATLQPDASAAMRLIHGACQAHGNIDSLVMAMARYSRGRPHSSAALKLMGVPTEP